MYIRMLLFSQVWDLNLKVKEDMFLKFVRDPQSTEIFVLHGLYSYIYIYIHNLIQQ